MKNTLAIFFTVLTIFTIIFIDSSFSFSKSKYQEIVDNFSMCIEDQQKEFLEKLGVKGYFTIFEKELLDNNKEMKIDINKYFDILGSLSILNDYSLEYFYCFFSMSGRPIIYAKKNNRNEYDSETACAIWSSLVGSWDESDPDYAEILQKRFIRYVKTDGTPMGFFQLAVLYLMGDSFLLADHENYSKLTIICDKQTLTRIVSEYIPKQLKADALKINPEPIINLKEENATIEIYSFSKYVGILKKTFTIRKSFPHAVLDLKTEVILDLPNKVKI